MTMWLIGMMGAGKTSCGSRAATLLGVPFHDTDLEVARQAEISVADLWAELGEARFRELEAGVLSKLAGAPAIVATGGGAVVDPGNRQIMSESGQVVWLVAPARELLARIGAVDTRPLLAAAADPLEELTGILYRREDLYETLADVTIDTSGRTIDEVAAEIGSLWEP